MSITSASVAVKDLRDLLYRKGGKFRTTAANHEIDVLLSDLCLLQKLLENFGGEGQLGVHDGWLTEIVKACYDVEDLVVQNIIKDYDADTESVYYLHSVKRWFFSYLVDDHEFLREISLLGKKIKQLVCICEALLSSGSCENNVPPPLNNYHPYDNCDDDDVVGMEDEMDALLNRILLFEEKEDDGLLESSASDSLNVIISVAGIGGLGKTTLARSLYNHERVRCIFDAFAWVTLGPEVWEIGDLTLLFRSILKQLVPDLNDDMLKKHLMSDFLSEIQKLLSCAKCLVVLDDLRSPFYWYYLCDCFSTTSSSKLLVTTRFMELHPTIVPFVDVYQLRHLTKAESLELLVRRAFLNNIPEDPLLYGVLEYVVTRYEGTPLAFNMLGRLLATKHSSGEWEAVLHAMRSCDAIHHEYSMEQLELELLSLCYEDLPDQLKPCFLYLGLFSHHSDIEVETLYQLWMAEGYVQPPNCEGSGMTMMDTAEQYLEELATRGFVEVHEVEVPNIRRFRSCHLHGMMLDFCLFKAKQEIFPTVMRSHLNKEIFKSPTSFVKTRRLVMYIGLEYRSEEIPSVLKNFEYLRSLLLLKLPRHLEFVKFSESVELEAFLLLKVLSFDGFDLRGSKFIGEVEKFSCLQYLSFRGCYLENLTSCLGELLNLQTLDLRVAETRAVTVPNVIWKLSRLLHLYLPSRYKVHGDEKLRLDSLVNLETLENFDTNVCCTMDLFFLSNLRNLTASVLWNPDYLQDIIKCINMVRSRLCQTSIKIIFVDLFRVEERNMAVKQLFECPTLHMLYIQGCTDILPNVISYSLTKMVLSHSALVDDPMRILGSFPKLRVLVLQYRAFLGKILICMSGGFCELRELTLTNLPELEFLIEEEGSMPHLCTLRVENCYNLRELPFRFRQIQQKNYFEPSVLGFPDRRHKWAPRMLRLPDHYEWSHSFAY